MRNLSSTSKAISTMSRLSRPASASFVFLSRGASFANFFLRIARSSSSTFMPCLIGPHQRTNSQSPLKTMLFCDQHAIQTAERERRRDHGIAGDRFRRQNQWQVAFRIGPEITQNRRRHLLLKTENRDQK